MTLEERTAGLLRLVESERQRRCDALRDAARAEAERLLGEARRAARLRVRTALAEERARAAARVAAAKARLATARRLAQQRRAHALLELAWQRLPAALAARWADAEAQAAWIRRVVAAALQHLPRGEWQIEHAPGIAATGLAPVTQWLGQQGVAATFRTDAALAAGLRIRSGSNLIDGSTRGLLAERNAIGARLLATLEGAS